MGKKIKTIQRLLLEPWQLIPDPVRYKQASLLAGLLLLIILLQLISLVVMQKSTDSIPLVFMTGMTLDLFAYFLARSRFYSAGALLWGITNSSVTLFSIVTGAQMGAVETGLFFMSFSLLLPALVVGPIIVAGVGIFNVMGIMLLSSFSMPGLSLPGTLSMPLIFNLALTVLTTGLIYYRDYLGLVRQREIREKDDRLSRIITERKRSEQELESALDLSEQIINASPIGISIYDENGQCIVANESIADIVGAKREQVLAQNFRHIPSWEQCGLLEQAEAALEHDERNRGEFELTSSFGKHAVYDCIFVPFKQHGKQRLLLMVDDMTKHKQAQKHIAEQAQLLEQVFQYSLDNLVVLDRDYNFVRVSESYAKGCGMDVSEIEGKNHFDLFPSDFEQELEPFVRNKEIYKRLARPFIFPDHPEWGITYWDIGLVPILDEIGEIEMFLFTLKDVTEKERAEAELKKYRDQLEELVEERTRELRETQDELVRKERLATLGQLTATVSHELRNPLGAMRPSLYVIEKKSDKQDNRVQQAIQRVDRNIDRCDHIIDELLDFTRITELDKHLVQIDKWLNSVIDEQIIPKQIRVEKDFSLPDVEVAIDTDRMRRAVINVVDNGCQAMRDDNHQVKGRSNACLRITTGGDDKRIAITISDTGSGISEAVLAKIFEPLFSTKGFGVGLGMPTVEQIMKQHRGGVEIETIVGQGASVILWIPAFDDIENVA